MGRYTSVPIAFETMGTTNASGADFIDEIGKRTHALYGNNSEKGFLWQRLSVGLQRYNSVCFRGTFQSIDEDLASGFSPKEKMSQLAEAIDSHVLGTDINVALKNAFGGSSVALLIADNSLCDRGPLNAV